jgi:hypothetical protein
VVFSVACWSVKWWRGRSCDGKLWWKAMFFAQVLKRQRKEKEKVASLLQHGIYMHERGRCRGRLDASAMKKRSNHSEFWRCRERERQREGDGRWWWYVGLL